MKYLKPFLFIFIFTLFLPLNKTQGSENFTAEKQNPESLSTGAIIAKSDGEIIDCNKTPLFGKDLYSAASNNGIGILVSNKKNVTVKNCDIFNFYFGLFAENAPGLKIENSSFHGNNIVTKDFYPDSFSKEANISKSIAEGQIITFIDKTAHEPFASFPTTSDIRKWEKGGAIIIQNSDNISIKNSYVTGNFTGVGLFNVSNSEISDNNLSYNPGFGIFLYNATYNTINNNNLSHSNNLVEWIRKPGIDNAAIMVIHGSSYNKITNNNMDYSADGLFLSAAETPPYPTSDYNYIAGNTARYSPHNAFEVVFSYGNVLENNDASYSGYGFWATYGEGLKIINNKIIGNISAGIAIHQGLNYEITGNTIQDSGWYEITGEKRNTSHPDGFGILIIADDKHNWKSVFPANKNINIKSNQFINNQKAIGIDGNFEINGTPENSYLKNASENIINKLYNAFTGVEKTIENNYFNTFKDNRQDINYGPDYKIINTNAEAKPSCKVLSKGTSLNPYVITFIGDGFTDVSTVRDNFIPSCTGQIGTLNPATAFPSIIKNVSNLGIFSRKPFKSNKEKFTIQYVNSLNTSQNFGCQTNGSGCDYSSIKNTALSTCSNTNAIFLFKNNGFFGWTTNNGPDPFASGNIPLIAIGVGSSKDRIENEAWGVCPHEFGHAFGFLADEIGGIKTISETGYNSKNVANCALPSECQTKFGKNSPCIAGCGFSDSLSRSRQNSIMAGNITSSIPNSTTFSKPSRDRLINLIKKADILPPPSSPSFSGTAITMDRNGKSYFDEKKCNFSVSPISNAEEYLFTIKMSVKDLIESAIDDVIEIYNSSLDENYKKSSQKNSIENCNFFKNNLDINKMPLSVKNFLSKEGVEEKEISLFDFLNLSNKNIEVPLIITASVKVNKKWSEETKVNISFLNNPILPSPTILFPKDGQILSLEDCYIETTPIHGAKYYFTSDIDFRFYRSLLPNANFSYLKSSYENKAESCTSPSYLDNFNILSKNLSPIPLNIYVSVLKDEIQSSNSSITVYLDSSTSLLPLSTIISPKNDQTFDLKNCYIETTPISEADSYKFSFSFADHNYELTTNENKIKDCSSINDFIFSTIEIFKPVVTFPAPLGIKVYAIKNGKTINEESSPISVNISPTTPSSASNNFSVPVFIYPKDGQNLTLGEIFKFTIAPMKGATAFRFSIYQNDKLIYNSEQDVDAIAKGEKFSFKSYYNPVPGALEIRASAKVNGTWTPETTIKVNLINQQKSELENSFNQKLAGSLPTLYQLLNPLLFFLK